MTVEDLFPYISRVANLPPGTGLVAYEEVRPGEVGPPLDEKLTLKECEMMYDQGGSWRWLTACLSFVGFQKVNACSPVPLGGVAVQGFPQQI